MVKWLSRVVKDVFQPQATQSVTKNLNFYMCPMCPYISTHFLLCLAIKICCAGQSCLLLSPSMWKTDDDDHCLLTPALIDAVHSIIVAVIIRGLLIFYY